MVLRSNRYLLLSSRHVDTGFILHVIYMHLKNAKCFIFKTLHFLPLVQTPLNEEFVNQTSWTISHINLELKFNASAVNLYG